MDGLIIKEVFFKYFYKINLFNMYRQTPTSIGNAVVKITTVKGIRKVAFLRTCKSAWRFRGGSYRTRRTRSCLLNKYKKANLNICFFLITCTKKIPRRLRSLLMVVLSLILALEWSDRQWARSEFQQWPWSSGKSVRNNCHENHPCR